MGRSVRCNYCRALATVWVTYRGYIARAGRLPYTPSITAAACAVHESCVNFQEVMRRHPEAKLARIDGRAE